PVLVLHGEHVDAIDVEKVGRVPIGVEIGLCDLEAHAGWIRVATPGVVHRHDDAIDGRELGGDGVAQVRREGRNAALPRHVIAEQGDGANGTCWADGVDGFSYRARGVNVRARPPRPATDRPTEEISLRAFGDKTTFDLASPSLRNVSPTLRFLVTRRCALALLPKWRRRPDA